MSLLIVTKNIARKNFPGFPFPALSGIPEYGKIPPWDRSREFPGTQILGLAQPALAVVTLDSLRIHLHALLNVLA